MKLDKINLPTLYAKATEAFVQARANNPSLSQEQLGMPWEEIEAKENNVSVKFSGRDSKSYVIEAKLDLMTTDGETIGWYSLLEDENENVFDDYLVFN